MQAYDVIVLGAGAAGLMCAITAGQRGRRVLVLDHANKAGKKILMSGGGRCNFTNLEIHPSRFLSANPHFCKSALARYTQWDFIAWVSQHEIPWHEKTLGQLFCDNSSKDILQMLLDEAAAANVEIRLDTPVNDIVHANGHYHVNQTWSAESLVVATGGLSIPKMGASGFGYQVAAQFDVPVLPTRAGLVPFTLTGEPYADLAELSGLRLPQVQFMTERQTFTEDLLITHRGVSGPVVLQASSYWYDGETVYVDLLPGVDVVDWLQTHREQSPQMTVQQLFVQRMPRRFAEYLVTHMPENVASDVLQQVSNAKCQQLAEWLHRWPLKPAGTEGYRTAEVTLGGVDTDALSSQTMEVKQQPGLYFIGEVVDVTGWLGGYNFQWAWASGHAAGEVV